MDHRIHQIPQQALQHQISAKPNSQSKGPVFKELLENEKALVISKHAHQRLHERNIQIDDRQWQAINDKVKEARQKGITDSLVVTNQAALLVNAANNTVITAMDRQEATSRIFTNINGTILINE